MPLFCSVTGSIKGRDDDVDHRNDDRQQEQAQECVAAVQDDLILSGCRGPFLIFLFCHGKPSLQALLAIVHFGNDLVHCDQQDDVDNGVEQTDCRGKL